MNATIYTILMIVSFALSGVFLVVAVILFFRLKVKSAIDELSGKRAKKQIAEFRKENASVKGRGYVPGIFEEKESEKNTASLSNKESGKLKKSTSQLSTKDITEQIDELMDESGGTVLLNDIPSEPDWGEGTTVLGSLDDDDEGTTILVDDDEGTTLLTDDADSGNGGNKKCNVIREIVVLESDDYIKVE